ncbi:hypothetical protein BASA81_008046 [Batrachochytrium salamandrivorans]|nr:hypothetical protein BASA81_008046 [Batrachochytrium salamandrivorans]
MKGNSRRFDWGEEGEDEKQSLTGGSRSSSHSAAASKKNVSALFGGGVANARIHANRSELPCWLPQKSTSARLAILKSLVGTFPRLRRLAGRLAR